MYDVQCSIFKRQSEISFLQVKYPSGVEVKDGNELTPTQVKDQPEVNFKADKNSFYTLIMTGFEGLYYFMKRLSSLWKVSNVFLP